MAEKMLQLAGVDPCTEEKLAASLTAEDAGLVPFLPYLLQDIYQLGGSGALSAQLLEELGPSTPARLLDLACGKGAVSLEIARRLDYTVRGVDLLPPFVAEANNRAERAGLANRCQYVVGDVNLAVRELAGWDVVLFCAAGDVLGPPAEMLGKLKGTLRAWGYIVLDESFLPEAAARGGRSPGEEETGDPGILYQNYEYLTEENWAVLFREAGLREVARKLVAAGEMAEGNAADLAAIEKRAAELMTRYPEKAALFAGYVASQHNEVQDLENSLINAVWLLQRTD